MNGAINYTYGFSHGVEWGWPIAVYLLLAGISGGALIVALLVRFYKKQQVDTPLLKAASLVSFVTIALGMVFLVGDLEKPLYFWKILIHYNFTSVMSIGVMAISIYIPLSLIMCFYLFEKEISVVLAKKSQLLGYFEMVMVLLKKIRPMIEVLSVVFAVVICAYTGFLISVLVRFPILNTAILPALFVVSGLSAGTASASMVASYLFKEDTHSSDLKTLHVIEWPIMAVEIMLIAMLFVSLLVGNEFQQTTTVAFQSGVYANLFWFGVMGVGFGLPLVLNFALGKHVAHSHMAFYLSGMASVLGVLCLRMFIIYAGQTFSI
ncbi:NrfD/PsrC family molybdoenzyme membrane anchor subunit [Sulfurospirillum arsenophilum]|uniref:NrfD/PsrC family molybdoenzyme membrane anchor subunit n=1 Tax=Sulfurospirillum arsenophilum TaxID=56698 RepID=UPI0005AA9E3E|nr:NrfD/PsrC family molybdoenzyme membrane anchor subunit [Sulfurospirillum arsenophilum]